MGLAWGESGVGPREFSRRPLAPGDELRQVPVLAPLSEEFRLMRPLGILRASRSVAYRVWLRLLLRCPMEAPMVAFFSIAALMIFFAGVMTGHAFTGGRAR